MFDRKQDIMNRLKAKRQMANYRANQAQINQPQQNNFSKTASLVNDSLKTIGNIKNIWNKMGTSTTLPQEGMSSLSKLSGGISTEGSGLGGNLMGTVGSGLNVAMDAKDMFSNGVNAKNATDAIADGATLALGATGVGAPAAMAIQGAKLIKNMVMGAKDKAEQEAIQKSQAEAQKGMSQAENATQQFQNNIAQTQQENNQKMQEQMQQNNQGYMGELPNLGVSDATDVNIPNTTQTPQEVASIPSENEQTIPQDNSSIVSSILNAVKGGTTGGASDVKPLPAEGSASAELGQADKYNQVAQPEVQTEGQTTKDEILNSVKNRLGTDTGNAFRDFFNGYQDNRNTSFIEGDLYNNLANGTIEPSQNEEGQLTGGASEIKKSIMNRLGEMAGTGARVLTNPAVQAGIAGLVTKATGGDNAEVAQNMVKYGFDKAKSNAYAKQMGLQPTILGNYDATDLKNYNDNIYHTRANDIQEQHYNDQIKQKYAELEEKVRHNKATETETKLYHDLLIEMRKRGLVIQQQNADTNKKKAEASIKNAQTKIDLLTKDKATKDEMNSNLAKYYSILQSGDKAKIDKAKEGLLANYGTDFLGVLKNFDKLLEEDED